MHKLFTGCTEQVRFPYTEYAAGGLPNPTHLEGEVRFDQAQELQVVTTRSPRIVTECLLTRSMLVIMYVYTIYSRFRIGTVLSIRKHGYEFIITLSLSSLMSPFSLSFFSVLLMLNTLVLSMYLDVCAKISISNLRLPSDWRAILIGRLPHLAMISSPRGVSIYN